MERDTNGEKCLVTVADLAGFCPGVKDAIEDVLSCLRLNAGEKEVYCREPVVHNHSVMKMLEGEGLKIYDPSLPGEGKIFVVSAHGASRSEFQDILNKGYEILDTTCCYVKSLQDQYKKYADQSPEEGYQIILTGDPKHQEIIGILGQSEQKRTYVISNHRQAEELIEDGILDTNDPLVVFSQTTFSPAEFGLIRDFLKRDKPATKIRDTICKTVEQRIEAAKILAEKVEIMFVVGSKISSNSNKLYDSIKNICQTYFIEDASKITCEMIEGAKKIGITAGASTMDQTIEEVVKRIEAN